MVVGETSASRMQEVVSSGSGGDVEVVVLMQLWWIVEKVHAIARKNVLWRR